MSIQFPAKAFERARALQALVLVGLGGAEVTDRRDDGLRVKAGFVARCLAALRHARLREIPVLYAQHDAMAGRIGGPIRGPIDGIENLRPKRSEGVFLRRGPSCFDNPFFAEAAAQFKWLAFAGVFNGREVRLAAADAHRAGNHAVFLIDAIQDRSARFSHPNGPAADIAYRGGDAVRTEPTAAWIALTKACSTHLPNREDDIRSSIPDRRHGGFR